MRLAEIDLRPISRESDKLYCKVFARGDDYEEVCWLTLGAASLQSRNEGQMSLIARMDATDFEHDSAYVIVLPLIGVALDSVHNHITRLTAWVDPDAANTFSVPSTGYDPTTHKDAHRCEEERCAEPHWIVPEGYYTPPHDKKLYAQVRGKRVTILFGPVRKNGEAL